MNDTSEEKSLPASQKKLRDARRKGQVARSQDLVAAIALLAATLYIVAAYPSVLSKIEELTDLSTRAYSEAYGALYPRMVALAFEILLSTLAPLLGVVALAAIVANVVVMRGPVFSMEPIRPKFEHVNPANGFKRIFSLKSGVEFLKSVFKVAALGLAFVVVFTLGLQALLESPACGMGCVYDTSIALLKPMTITALITFFVVGAIDVVLQRQLFLRDMRMTKTEAKRENKDMEGDPIFKRERRRIAQEVSSGTAKVGLKNSSILIGQTAKVVVGLRFVRGETPVPIITCRAEGPQANVLMTEANLLGIPVVADGDLARDVHDRAKIGSPVPDGLFQQVADILVAAKLV